MPGSSEVEQGPVKAKVAGSTPAPAANARRKRKEPNWRAPRRLVFTFDLVKDRKTGKFFRKYPGFPRIPDERNFTMPPMERRPVYGPEAVRWARAYRYDYTSHGRGKPPKGGVQVGATFKERLRPVAFGWEPLSLGRYTRSLDAVERARRFVELRQRPHRVVLPGFAGSAPTVARNPGRL